MAKFTNFEPCPKCISQGRDSRGDNLARYSDGGGHCFSCGHHEHPKYSLNFTPKEINVTEDKALLPPDFTRDIPAAAWKWLLQYGLSYQYWKPYTGYSPKEERLVLTVGNPIAFSIGRYVGSPTATDRNGRPMRKWFLWGDRNRHVEVLGKQTQGKCLVLVEDLISAHKVGQLTTTIPLFGTAINDVVVNHINSELNDRPVVLWLDADQYGLLQKKVTKLQTFLKWPVKYIHTPKDPKEYSLDEISTLLRNEI